MVAPPMKKSRSVKYPRAGTMFVVANMNAIKVSMAVAESPSWVPKAAGSIQKTDQDMATIRLSGRIISRHSRHECGVL